MSKNNLYCLSLDSIKYVLGLISATVDLPTTILDDLNIATNTTYSSYRLDTLLKALKEENIKYCDEAIAGLNKLTKEIVDDSSKVVKENTIYLILTNPVNNVYEQWLLINGTPQMIGTTEMNLDSVYTKDEADARYSLITDFNSLKAKVDGKVDKTDIVDNLTSTDTNKPLSANQGKVLKDEVDLKANDDEVLKKTDIVTTIDKTSTDNQVPTARAIYNNPKNKIPVISNNTDIFAYADSIEEYVTITVKLMNGVNSPYGADNINNDFYYTIYNMPSVNYKRIVAYDIRKNDIYMNIKHVEWGAWKKVCTTSVADVLWTELTMSSGISGGIYYRIKNGICYVYIISLSSPTMSINNQIITSGLPIPESTGAWYSLTSNNYTQGCLLVRIDDTGKMVNHMGTNGASYFGSFSYPVAES